MTFNAQVLCAVSHLPRVQQLHVASNIHSSEATPELSTLSTALDSLEQAVRTWAFRQRYMGSSASGFLFSCVDMRPAERLEHT